MRTLWTALYIKSDAAAGRVAALATTIGQMAIVALGVHLAADSLDDHLVVALTEGGRLLADLATDPMAAAASALGMPDATLVLWHELPLRATAAWAALLCELCTTLLLWSTFVLTPRAGRATPRQWWRARSVHAVVAPFALAGTALAGAWSMAMAVEDLLPTSDHTAWLPSPTGALIGLAALIRFGIPAWCRAVADLEPPPRRSDGLGAALLLGPVGVLAWANGVPIWAWVAWLGGGA